MNKKCINATAHFQNILHWDTLYNIHYKILQDVFDLKFDKGKKKHEFILKEERL